MTEIEKYRIHLEESNSDLLILRAEHEKLGESLIAETYKVSQI